MSIFGKWEQSIKDRNADGMIELLHEDYTFVRHQTGSTMNKSETSEMYRGFLSSEGITTKEHRCVYENDDVLVEHSVIDFADGSTESILACHTLKDGLIIRTETGATLIKK